MVDIKTVVNSLVSWWNTFPIRRPNKTYFYMFVGNNDILETKIKIGIKNHPSRCRHRRATLVKWHTVCPLDIALEIKIEISFSYDGAWCWISIAFGLQITILKVDRDREVGVWSLCSAVEAKMEMNSNKPSDEVITKKGVRWERGWERKCGKKGQRHSAFDKLWNVWMNLIG